MMNPFGNITRRQSLGMLGTLLASTVVGVPFQARAQSGEAISPPKLRSAMGNEAQLLDYEIKYAEFVEGFAERYPTQEMAPVPDQLDELYVLNCTTRKDIPINHPENSTMTYFAPAYVDGYEDDSIAELPPRPTVGPTLEMRRGNVTGVMLNNEIEVCGDSKDNMQFSDDNPESGHTPHGFQVTNLHTHGLHVSPNAPSDDVLVTVDSAAPLHGKNHGSHKALHGAIFAGDGTYFPYIYDMRDDHPVGTFWYHPHKHGWVASQVAPGMAGALIVRENGDGDADFATILAEHGITEADEEIIVIQTLKGQEATMAGDASTLGVFFPQAYYDSYSKPPAADCYGLDVGKTSLSLPLTVNGVVNPTITMEPGQIKRLRIVNAASGATFVPTFGESDDLEFYAIAVDGIALQPKQDDQTGMNEPYYKLSSRVDPDAEPSRYWTMGELMTIAPGQRLDVLVRVKDGAGVGTVQIADANVTADQTNQERATKFPPNVIQTNTSQKGNLWQIEITQSTGDLRDQQLPTKQVFAHGQISRPPSPFEVVSDKSVQYQELVFRSEKLDPPPANGARNPTFTINGMNFDPNLDDQAQIILGLNQVTRWRLYSSNDAHIFHIHINSFQAMGRETPGQEPFVYEMPIWRDTIYFDGTSEENATRVYMASYQVDYTGEYVLHCHNLFHEDSGMMLSVAVKDLA